MGSINAQRLAREISATIRKGKKVVLARSLKKVGYAHSVSRKPNLITNTVAFKKAFALENIDILAGIDKDIARMQLALAQKNLNKEEAKTLVTMLDTLIKNKQLLSGGATANIGISIAISEHVAGKYADVGQKGESVENQGSTEPRKG